MTTQVAEQQIFSLEVGGQMCAAVEMYGESMIDEGIRQMGCALAEQYRDVDSILMVPLLQGASVYAMELLKAMRNAGAPPINVDAMRVKSYEETESSGALRKLQDLTTNPEGRHVLVVDDIFDSGLTLLGTHLDIARRNPASIRTTTLLDKPNEKRIPGVAERIGGVMSVITMEKPEFVIGRGMDYKEDYRLLRYIAKVVNT